LRHQAIAMPDAYSLLTTILMLTFAVISVLRWRLVLKAILFALIALFIYGVIAVSLDSRTMGMSQADQAIGSELKGPRLVALSGT
jgi:hypothetical protein